MENDAVKRIKEYISEHIREPITASDVAKAAGKKIDIKASENSRALFWLQIIHKFLLDSALGT